MQQPCTHDILFAGLCTVCGHASRHASATSDFRVLNARGKRSLTVRAETLEAFHVLQTQKQLQRRKLVLVLDLDHVWCKVRTRGKRTLPFFKQK